MDLGLEGKVAVVTGSGAGIGLAVRRVLAAEGTRVGRPRRDPEEVVDGVEHHRLDLTEAGLTIARWMGAVDRHGSLALLVNNAGGGTIRDGFLVRHRRRPGTARPVRAEPDGSRCAPPRQLSRTCASTAARS